MGLMRRGRTGAVEDELLIAPLAAGDEKLGLLCCVARERAFDDEDAELLHAVAHQTAVGLKKAELIERLTAENIVKDMFEALAAGSVEAAEAKAAEARCDLSRPHVFLHVGASAVAGETTARRGPSRRPVRKPPAQAVSTRVLRLPPRLGARDRAAANRRHRRRGAAAAGLPGPCRVGGSGGGPQRRGPRRGQLTPADAGGRRRGANRQVARRRGGAVSYEALGAYKYLVHLELDDAPHDRYRSSVEELIEYDRRRGARLVETLERFLADRGSVAASARALYIHPNTVRQRLERIERVTGLDLGKEDLLSLELALKLARLHDAGEPRATGGR